MSTLKLSSISGKRKREAICSDGASRPQRPRPRLSRLHLRLLIAGGHGPAASYLEVMKRAAAFLSYYVGLALGLGAMFNVAREADVWQFLFIPLWGLPIWWIAAGIGIRLGMYPSEFFRTLAMAAGFLEPQSRRGQAAARD